MVYKSTSTSKSLLSYNFKQKPVEAGSCQWNGPEMQTGLCSKVVSVWEILAILFQDSRMEMDFVNVMLNLSKDNRDL